MVLGINTLEGAKNTQLDGGPDLPQQGEGRRENLAHCGPLTHLRNS